MAERHRYEDLREVERENDTGSDGREARARARGVGESWENGGLRREVSSCVRRSATDNHDVKN